jgi:hypothetical protein
MKIFSNICLSRYQKILLLFFPVIYFIAGSYFRNLLGIYPFARAIPSTSIS